MFNVVYYSLNSLRWYSGRNSYSVCNNRSICIAPFKTNYSAQHRGRCRIEIQREQKLLRATVVLCYVHGWNQHTSLLILLTYKYILIYKAPLALKHFKDNPGKVIIRLTTIRPKMHVVLFATSYWLRPNRWCWAVVGKRLAQGSYTIAVLRRMGSNPYPPRNKATVLTNRLPCPRN